MATAGEKFMKSLKVGDWKSIERALGIGMSELGQPGTPEMEFTAMLNTIAAKRTGNKNAKPEDADDLTLEELNDQFSSNLEKLGFKDDEDAEAEDFTTGSRSRKKPATA